MLKIHSLLTKKRFFRIDTYQFLINTSILIKLLIIAKSSLLSEPFYTDSAKHNVEANISVAKTLSGGQDKDLLTAKIRTRQMFIRSVFNFLK